MHTSFAAAVLSFACLFAMANQAVAITVNFDDVSAPSVFNGQSPLTTAYSALGVVFSGPVAGSGGVILNQGASFGVLANTGTNLFAFNMNDPNALADSGSPIGPETLTFSTPINNFSILASGGRDADTFQAVAFQGATAVATTSASNASDAYGQLSLSAPSINRVVLSPPIGDTGYVYDTLIFTQVPEPGTLALCAAALPALKRRRR